MGNHLGNGAFSRTTWAVYGDYEISGNSVSHIHLVPLITMLLQPPTDDRPADA
jgi:hypothetical protein